jgi:hypothetical protein
MVRSYGVAAQLVASRVALSSTISYLFYCILLSLSSSPSISLWSFCKFCHTSISHSPLLGLLLPAVRLGSGLALPRTFRIHKITHLLLVPASFLRTFDRQEVWSVYAFSLFFQNILTKQSDSSGTDSDLYSREVGLHFLLGQQLIWHMFCVVSAVFHSSPGSLLVVMQSFDTI